MVWKAQRFRWNRNMLRFISEQLLTDAKDDKPLSDQTA